VGRVCDLCGAGGFVEHTIADLDHGRHDLCRYQAAVEVLRATVLSLGCAAATLFAGPSWADSPDGPVEVQTPDAGGVQPAAPSPNLSERHWYNQLPFIPVPEVASDPNAGTTVGILPVWLRTDDQNRINRIIAPDVFYNPNFGYGFHGRIYDYPSEDYEWSILGGLKERVEREFDAEYTLGRLRETRWSFVGSVIYDRGGAARFFGIGNDTPQGDETNFTNQQEILQAQLGWNFNHEWQLLYTARLRSVDVLPGTLNKVASIETRFAHIRGLGTNYEQLNRLSIIYDTRDSFTAPRQGVKWVAYGGVASRSGLFNESLYSEAGIDGRVFWPINPETVLASHVSLHYLPSAHRIPFWALSSLGGGQADVGGEQPLRGYGDGRFYDRNSFSASVELRRTAFSFDAISHVEIEIAPFVDVGDVFSDAASFPIKALHKVAGVGFRGIARPSVVGYVDIGYGSEGAAVFTGINYPF
jgi:Omp85 superfamily domain